MVGRSAGVGTRSFDYFDRTEALRWVHSRAIPVKGPDGVARIGVGISQDITERKAMEEQLASSRRGA